MLQREETRKNAEDYINQFAKIIDVSNVRVYYNSEGLDKVNFN
jgi:tyrosyl-tRNA synthetase